MLVTDRVYLFSKIAKGKKRKRSGLGSPSNPDPDPFLLLRDSLETFVRLTFI